VERGRTLRGVLAPGFVALVVASVGVLGSVPAASAASTVPAETAPGVYTAPGSISSDCSRDVTAEIVAWIASVPDNSTLYFTPNGCYRVDGTIQIKYRNGLTLDGQGATFREFTNGMELGLRDARTRGVFAFWRGSNLTLRNTIAIGANPNAGTRPEAYFAPLEAQTAYTIGGVDGMVLDGVQAYDVYGDFVYVGPATRNLLVENSRFARNGRQGWTVNGGQNITFDHNSISQTRRATIDMEPSNQSDVASNITFSNNQIGPGRLFFFSSEGVASTIDGVNIIGNRLTGKSMTIHVNPPKGIRSNYRVVGNYSDTRQLQDGGGVMAFSDVVGLEVRDNRQPVQANFKVSGVSIRNCRDVTVAGNKFLNAISPALLRPGNVNVSNVDNMIGNPLRPAGPVLLTQG
jgi:Right handed beta helix region